MAASTGGKTTFLLSINDSIRNVHDVVVSFKCANPGRVELVRPPGEAVAALTAPGPGRVRPDTTAVNGALAAWNATFPEAATFDQGRACSESQALRFSAAGRDETSQFTWEATLVPSLPEAGQPLLVTASVDGAAPQTVSVFY